MSLLITLQKQNINFHKFYIQLSWKSVEPFSLYVFQPIFAPLEKLRLTEMASVRNQPKSLYRTTRHSYHIRSKLAGVILTYLRFVFQLRVEYEKPPEGSSTATFIKHSFSTLSSKAIGPAGEQLRDGFQERESLSLMVKPPSIDRLK